jgi:misacylated tRNA(Ala) deacylase
LTQLLYLNDSYLKEFEAKVVSVTEDAVELDRTAFYPKGGGQPSDEGQVIVGDQSHRVLEVFRDAGRVLHRLEGSPPNPGTPIRGQIDWTRRYALMRYHSALHVLCGVIFRGLGVLVTGGQMYTDRARMDFALEDLGAERIALIERDSNRAIAENRAIKISVLPREEAFKIPDLVRTQINLLPPAIQEIRVVEIEGLDLQADGGTHVAHTGEIGPLRVTKTENKGRINKRLEIALEG